MYYLLNSFTEEYNNRPTALNTINSPVDFGFGYYYFDLGFRGIYLDTYRLEQKERSMCSHTQVGLVFPS